MTKMADKELKELEKTIKYDLEALKDSFMLSNKEDFDYHFKLLKGNLADYFKEAGKNEKMRNLSKGR